LPRARGETEEGYIHIQLDILILSLPDIIQDMDMANTAKFRFWWSNFQKKALMIIRHKSFYAIT
jgi:hypothetical protein